jgi:hypothetical protein
VKLNNLAAEFAEALEADNFTEVNRLARVHGMTPADTLAYCLIAAAAVYADGSEPRRSAGFSALLKIMELLQDDRFALARKLRHRAGLPV